MGDAIVFGRDITPDWVVPFLAPPMLVAWVR